MSIIIKGVKMPKWCSACVCNSLHYCQILGRDVSGYLMTNKFPDDCPLVELPPHGRLIDADALEEEPCDLIDDRGLEAESGYSHEQIRNAPTIIEAEEGE